MPAPVCLLYFAWVRERIGRGEERLELPAEVTQVAELRGWLARLGPGYAEAFASSSVRCAVNQVFAGEQTAVAAGDEVAFFPPVTGG